MLLTEQRRWIWYSAYATFSCSVLLRVLLIFQQSFRIKRSKGSFCSDYVRVDTSLCVYNPRAATCNNSAEATKSCSAWLRRRLKLSGRSAGLCYCGGWARCTALSCYPHVPCHAGMSCLSFNCSVLCIVSIFTMNSFDFTQTLIKKSFSTNWLLCLVFATSILTCFSCSDPFCTSSQSGGIALGLTPKFEPGIVSTKSPRTRVKLKHREPKTRQAQYKRRWMRILFCDTVLEKHLI